VATSRTADPASTARHPRWQLHRGPQRPRETKLVAVGIIQGQELETDAALEDAWRFHHGRLAEVRWRYQPDRRDNDGLGDKSHCQPAIARCKITAQSLENFRPCDGEDELGASVGSRDKSAFGTPRRGIAHPRIGISEAGDQASALVWNRDTRRIQRVRGPVAQPDRATVS
jgi:hypothetical protein